MRISSYIFYTNENDWKKFKKKIYARKFNAKIKIIFYIWDIDIYVMNIDAGKL